MGPWWEAYQPERQALSARLAPEATPEEARQALHQTIDGTLEGYLGSAPEGGLREPALFAAGLCRDALGLLTAQPKTRAVKGRSFPIEPLWAPLIIGGVLAVYLFLNGQFWVALLLLVQTVLWLLLLLRQRGGTREEAPRLTYDAGKLLRALDALMLETDRWLEKLQSSEEILAGQRLPELEGDVLESIQMLAEAQRDQDGAYALKALPGLFAGLLEKEVRLVEYSPERLADFDLYPSVAGERTIRPAVYLRDALMLRGQATRRVAPPEEVEEHAGEI